MIRDVFVCVCVCLCVWGFVCVCVSVCVRSLVSYFMKRHSLALPVGVPLVRLFTPVWTLPLCHILVVWAWPDPLPTRLKRVGKNI